MNQEEINQLRRIRKERQHEDVYAGCGIIALHSNKNLRQRTMELTDIDFRVNSNAKAKEEQLAWIQRSI